MNYNFSMKSETLLLFLISLCNISCKTINPDTVKTASLYKVVKLNDPMTVDGNWDKPQWQKVDALELKYFMGKAPAFRPKVKAKLMYDADYVYVIFQVKDKYVRCVATNSNAAVWEDSCVEFFFSPDSDSQMKYFNLESNCGGTVLMNYNLVPHKKLTVLDPEDIKQIKIAHSLPRRVLQEITDPVTWTVEYKIPLTLLEKYAEVTKPAPGVTWKANFYKIADKTSNPHYLTWSLVNQAQPDFHLPQFFGNLVFK